MIQIDLPEIPHGHGLSFKMGLADGLLKARSHESAPHPTHSASYEKGIAVGEELRKKIAVLVKD